MGCPMCDELSCGETEGLSCEHQRCQDCRLSLDACRCFDDNDEAEATR